MWFLIRINYFVIVKSLKYLNFSNKVTNMNSMFYNCFSLISLNLSNFNSNNANNLIYIFSYTYFITSLNLSNNAII